MNSEVVILLAADERFAMPLAVTLRSAFLGCTRPVRAIVLSDGVSRQAKRAVERACVSETSKRKIDWLDIDPSYLRNAPLGFAHLSRATYLRLAMGRLLSPEISRVIYIDSDILVVSDLARLWDTPLEGNLVAAAPDFLTPLLRQGNALGYCFDELQVPSDQLMFNAGLLLIDLAAYRTQNIESQCISFLDRWKNELRSADQDALNAVLRNNWKRLDYQWNVQVGAVANYKKSAHLTSADRDALENMAPAILHFSGANKPWNSGLRSSHCERYVNCVGESGWFGTPGFALWKTKRLASCVRRALSNKMAAHWPAKREKQLKPIGAA